MENKTEIEITLEDFKLIKSFYPEFTRIHNIVSNNFMIGWSELMPVVEIIDNINGCDFEMYPAYRHDVNMRSGVGVKINLSNSTHILVLPNGKSRIEVVYRSVIDFIKWYNNHGKNYGKQD